MTNAERFAKLISTSIPRVKGGTLRIWGAWFGRPYDNQHVVVSSEGRGEMLRLGFGGGEVLTVWAPENAEFDIETFQIGKAARVRWEWFYYGRAKIPENRYFEDFVLDKSAVHVKTNIDRCVPSFETDHRLPAVELL